MSGRPMPELVFVSGRQEGERAVLMANPVLVGRSGNADVRLQEESASREQLRFILTGAGWVMENLSVAGTVVNGRRHKKNKKLLLDTGDVLGVGVETEILFVAPGDDPEEAVNAWRQKHPRPTAAPLPLAPPPALPPLPEPRGVAATAQAQPAEEGRPETAKVPAAETKNKTLKYVMFMLMLGGVGFVSVAIALRPAGRDKGGGSMGPPQLEANAIELALNETTTRAPSPSRAVAELDLARRMFADRLRANGDLYRCVKHYKLHLAYRGTRTFASIQDEQDYARAMKDLVKQVKEKYDVAWKFERAESWQNARVAYEEIRDALAPEELDPGSEVYKVIYDNVIKHLGYVKWRMKEKKK